jgi:c-di-GMP-binding flagellar brake protein YcgR
MRKERRRFFRIDDILRVGYELLADDAVEEEIMHDDCDICIVASNFDNRIKTLLDTAAIQTPAVAELVDLVNKKLNFVIDHLDIGDKLHAGVQHCLRSANLSACGIAFADDTALEVGDRVKLDMVLQPDELHVRVIAVVVSCEEFSGEGLEESGSYFIRFDFDRIIDADQELLIQHTVKRQSRQLKALREELESGEENS